MAGAFRCVRTELNQVRDSRLEVGSAAGGDDLEKLIANIRAPVERVPGSVPVPGVSHDAHDRQLARIVGKFSDWVVVADDAMIIDAIADDPVDGLPTGLVHVHKDEAIRNYHCVTRIPAAAVIPVRHS
jgi:hypothetical protein